MFARLILSTRVIRGIVLTLFAIFLSACAQTGEFRFSTVEPVPVWPSPPQPVRYVFLGYLYGESNFVRNNGANDFFLRAFEIITGWVRGNDADRQLAQPQTGWVDDRTQQVFVTDSARKSIFVFDQAYGELKIWDDAGGGARYITPVGIAGLDSGEIWIVDADRKEIVRVSSDGVPVGRIAGDFQRPTGIAIDKNTKRVFIADSAAHTITVLSDAGQKLNVFGGKGDTPGQLNAPTHLAFSNGELFVSDTLNARVQVFDGDGNFLRQFGKRGMYIGDIPRPKGVAVDAEQRVYVVESYYDYLLVYDRDGKPLIPIGGAGAVQFDLPAGVWLDGFGRVYVADMMNRRVAVFQFIADDDVASSTLKR